MKKGFDLENADFSSDSEDEIKMPSQLFDLYTSEYCLVLNEAKQFFTECKELIFRFVSMNQFGLGFNIPMLLTSMMKMQNGSCHPKKNDINQQLNRWKQKKPKFQGEFHKTLEKMNTVIEDLISIQIEIKQAYLGQKVQRPLSKRQEPYSSKKRNTISGQSSSNNSKTLSIRKMLDNQLQQETCEEEQKLRKTLQNKLNNPSQEKQSSISKVCSLNYSLSTNFKNLDKKMSQILQQTLKYKQKEQKSYKMFQQKKQKQIISQNNEKEYAKQFDNVSIRKLSQKICDIKSTRGFANQFTVNPSLY